MGKQSRWQRKPNVEKERERDDEYQEIVGDIFGDKILISTNDNANLKIPINN